MATSTDLARINRIAGPVGGVREAVAIVDQRLKADTEPEPGPVAAAAPGVPIPGDRPALVFGPQQSRPPGRCGAGWPADPARTVTGALQLAASLTPQRGTTYVLPDGSTDRQTYAELLHQARLALTGLRELGLRPGDSVLLQCADSRTFVTAFWACVLGGFVPTAVGPAPDYGTDNAVLRKLHAAWELLDHPLVLTDTELRERVAGLRDRWADGASLRVASVAEVTSPQPAEPFPAEPDHPFVNLLTSGSTGTPKCVRHAHRTVVARTYAAIAGNGFTEHEVSLNWMPLDHVGGMVMFNVRDVFLRCEHVNARTESMIRHPLHWLDWIHRFRATNTWAPNFAFALVNKHREEIASGRWDLSSMRNICNAGEAVVARTALTFLELLAPHGLPADAMVPCWGMSETSSGVTYSRMDRRDRAIGTITLESASLDGQLSEVAPGTPGAVTLTEVGTPVAGVGLRIVDDAGQVLPEGRVGHLHVTGDTIMNGYLHNDAANAASFTADGWFDTGDLGFIRDGRLTLTGRQKHMVIVNGANYPAHEVEAVVEQVPGVRPACAAVCGVQDETTGTDAVIVFFVPTPAAAGDLDATITDIRTALTRDLALRPTSIVPVTAAEFPRAAGGKVQRDRLLEALRDGRFHDRMYGAGPAPAAATGAPRLLEPLWVPVEPAGADPDEVPTVLYAPVSASWPSQLRGVTGRISPGERFALLDDDHVMIDLLDPDQHERALTHLIGRSGAVERVVYAVETGPAELAADAPAGFLAALQAAARTVPAAELIVLSTGALGVRPDDDVIPGRAALTAMVRTALAERVLASTRLVDAPPDADRGELARLCRARYDADIVGVRDGRAYVPRLRTVAPTGHLDLPTRFLEPGGTVLLTGGLGGLGRSVAEHLLVSLDARLLIVGRTPPEQLARCGADEVLAGLRQLGDVRYAAVDVADRAALAAAVAETTRQWGSRLDLIVHLAGASIAAQWDDLPAHDLARETGSWLRHMLAPKLDGGAAIEALLADQPDAAVVLFSSVNGFLGGSGFGGYAAANAGLDGFAHRWSARGHTVRCVAWSMWSGPGMNDGNPLVAAAQRRGLQLIDPSDGLSLLLEALHQPQPYLLAGADPTNPHLKAHLAPDQFAGGSIVVAVVPQPSADPEVVRREVATALTEAEVFAQVTVVPQLPRDSNGAVDPAAVLASRENRYTRHLPPQGPTESALAQVIGEVLEVDPVGRDVSVFSLGCDSIRAVQLAEGLSAQFGRDVAVQLLYEHPTVGELAALIDTGPRP